MPTDQTLVIVGASLAGAKAAEGARQAGFGGRIVLIGNETELPYERPPLSKAVLRGEDPPEKARVHDAEFYSTNDIELWLGRQAEQIDPEGQTVTLDGGESLPYTTLVLATGAAPRHLDIPGADLTGVHYLRSLHDSQQLNEAIRDADRIAVVGAGWIGCEVAASAREMGADVLMIDPLPLPLHRVLGDAMGEMFRKLHADHGIDMRLQTGVEELRGTQSVREVVLSTGAVEAADLVVIGVGVTPRVELAEAAGLDVDNGVVVDDHLRASAPGIYAAGDVASAWHPHYQQHLRVEHWSNALNQGRAAGANAGGADESYTRLPYFFSDQYDLGMEYVGMNAVDDDVVVRGDLEGREFIAFWQRDGVVTAAMNVNIWDVVDDLRSIVGSGKPIAAERLTDPDIPLGELA